jgi:2-keto-4-pentenoate hydratase
MSSFCSPLAFLVWFALILLVSGRLLKNDKVHWTGSAGPALKARAAVPVVEDRSTGNFQFLSAATEREIPGPIGLCIC